MENMQGTTAESSPLAIPVFRAFWVASLFSNFGGFIQSVGASWMMISLSPAPIHVAMVQSSTTLPIMLLSLVSGAIADNLDRRIVMICAQSFMLIISTTLALFAWLGWLNPWLLLAFTFLIGCGTAFNAPAWQASIGEMVPRPALPAAVAYNTMGFNVARSAGPAIGGLIVSTIGSAVAFIVNAASYLGLIIVLSRWKPSRKANVLPREDIPSAVRAGVRYVVMSPSLRRVICRSGLFGLGAAGVPALMPLVAHHIDRDGAAGYGILLGAFGVGAVAGALGARPLRQRLNSEQFMLAGILALAVASTAVALSNSLFFSSAAMILAGIGWLSSLSTFNLTIQLGTPRWVVARALSFYHMVAFGAMAIGSWVFGWVAQGFGVQVSLLTCAAITMLSAAAGFVWPLSDLDHSNLEPLGKWSEPDTAVPVSARGGPIAVMIEYRVSQIDQHAFLKAITERRRIRVRDGASGWVLLRDLSDPEIWVERYHVATWLEYIRHNQRRTQADADNGEALKAVIRSQSDLTVRRFLEWDPGKDPEASITEYLEPMTDATRTN